MMKVGNETPISEPDRIVRQLSRRDEETEADTFALFLDPHHDHTTGVVFHVTAAGVQQLDPQLAIQLRSLGASRIQLGLLLLNEARLSVLAAVMAGLGGAFSEVGAVMMVGGNIRGQTQVLTTAIVQHTRMGRFETAIVLGVALLTLAFAVNLYLTYLQHGAAKR